MGSKKTGCSLKRTLGTSSARRKKSLKTASDVAVNAQVLPLNQAPPPPPLTVDTAPVLQTTIPPVTTPAWKQKPFNYPSNSPIQDCYTHKQK